MITEDGTTIRSSSLSRWGVGALTSLTLLALLLSSASARVPGQLRHQGRLLNDQGEPATGTKSLEFGIYDAQTGGAILWESGEYEIEPGEGGFYAVTIGSVSNPIDAGVLEGGERWLQVTIDGTALTPRMPLETAPYAALAGKAESVADGTVDRDALGNGFAVDWERLSGVPEGLDDGDDDLLATLNCQQGYIAQYDGNSWSCTEFQQVVDQQCGDGQVARGFDAQGGLICTDDRDTQLSQGEVDQFASSSGYVKQSTLSATYAKRSSLASVATSGDFGDLNLVPNGLSDGDDVQDADADPTNELQSLSKNGDTLSLSQDSTSVDLSGYRNTDDQTFSEVLSEGNDASGTDIPNVATLTASGLDMQGNAVDNASNVCDRTFGSCQEIAEAGCGSGSGTYRIDPAGRGSTQVYCDMDGGWTFTYVDNGQATSNVKDANDCQNQGMMLFAPVSKPHYDAAVRYLRDVLGKSKSPKIFGPMGLYSPVPGESGDQQRGPYNWDSVCDNRFLTSHHYVRTERALNGYSDGPAPCPFTSLAGDRFWTSDANHGDWTTEPNGDYDAGDWLIVQELDSDWYVTNHNDNTDTPNQHTYDSYLCMSKQDTEPRVISP